MAEDVFNLDELLQDLNKKDNNSANRQSEVGGSEQTRLDQEQLEQLLSLCQSKAEEFAMIGYDKVNKEEIWRYFESRYRNTYPPLHRMVNEILSLKITSFMNWITLNAYKGI